MATTEELSDTSSARWMVSFFCKTARTQIAALHSRWCEEGSAPSGSHLSWAVRKQCGHIFISRRDRAVGGICQPAPGAGAVIQLLLGLSQIL